MGRELRTLAGYSDEVYGAALTVDGRRGVSVSEDKTLRVWDLETGALVATFTCDADVWCCAFAGDRRIVAGDQSGRVHFLLLEFKEGRQPPVRTFRSWVPPVGILAERLAVSTAFQFLL